MTDSSRSMRSTVLDWIRIFNKNVFNKLTLALTRAGIGPFTIIYHRGRRSGRAYRTPLLVTFTGENALIPLPYGEHVDWLRNILVADGCEMFRKGNFIGASHPVILDRDPALALLPENRRQMFRRFSIPSFLKLRVPDLR